MMKHLNRKVIILLLLSGLVFNACKQESGTGTSDKSISSEKKQKIQKPEFNADSAYAFIKKQLEFGPRVPNTVPHEKCAEWLTEKLRDYTDTVYVQKTEVVAFDGSKLRIRNIVGSFDPELKNRILLGAHWDTRPFADQSAENKDEPIPGANDGGSGVGVLLEIARQLQQKDLNIGIDIILFDAEDYGMPQHKNLPYRDNTYCLGSQFWAKNPHVKGYSARYGIVLDMVGAEDATFPREGYSMDYAGEIVQKVWNTAAQLGYSNYFQFRNGDHITDDHKYINEIAKIPCIDIIHRDQTTMSGFGPYWHTHNDDMQVISRNTLQAVGEVVLASVLNETLTASSKTIKQ